MPSKEPCWHVGARIAVCVGVRIAEGAGFAYKLMWTLCRGNCRRLSGRSTILLLVHHSANPQHSWYQDERRDSQRRSSPLLAERECDVPPRLCRPPVEFVDGCLAEGLLSHQDGSTSPASNREPSSAIAVGCCRAAYVGLKIGNDDLRRQGLPPRRCRPLCLEWCPERHTQTACP